MLVSVQALAKRFAFIIDTITKLHAGFWVIVPWTGICAFNVRVTGSYVIHEMVDQYYGSRGRDYACEEDYREPVAQLLAICLGTMLSGFFE